MICPGWRARCCHCVRNILVNVVFSLWRKVWMRLPPGIVWPKWQSIRWMFSITSGRTICLVGYCFPPCEPQQSVAFASVCCWTTTIRPDLTTFYACLTAIPALKSGFLILSRFACCVRLVISPTFPVSIAVCTIKVSLSMAW